MAAVSNLHAVEDLARRGALFVVSHSAGKDSQAMALVVQSIVPADQILVVHAVLPEVEWDGVVEHIEATMTGIPIVLAYAAKTFFEMVDHRQMFPSPKNRQCTSDLKRGPIEREVRRYLKANPRFGGLVVMCMGMRALESTGRAKLETFQLNRQNSVAGREWYDWLPIHAWTADDVFAAIAAAGQKPHWAYQAGMTRLSCCFCIMSSDADLRTAARLNPALFERYASKEEELGFTLSMSRRPLRDIARAA
ncbi:phosphoadenosine phosphosulfate reductase [Rhizorhabdus wittichii DC-6]|nr:phosphoadenosine phosphosulfate reductase [Rhizorhabdus wittichii DC-6]